MLESFPADIWQEAGVYPELVVCWKCIDSGLHVSGLEETPAPRHIRHKLSANLSDDLTPVMKCEILYVYQSSSVWREICAK